MVCVSLQKCRSVVGLPPSRSFLLRLAIFFFVLIIWNAVSPDLMTLLHRNGVFSSMTEPRSQTVVITMSTAFLSVYVYVSSVCIELLLII